MSRISGSPHSVITQLEKVRKKLIRLKELDGLDRITRMRVEKGLNWIEKALDRAYEVKRGLIK